MKFNRQLSLNENMDAWFEYRLMRHATKIDELNDEQKLWLLKLNAYLRQLEDKYHPILAEKYSLLEARVNDPSDWMNEFNLEYAITFYLREDDAEYEEDDDNILIELSNLSFPTKKQDWGFGATHIDHAIDIMQISNEKHCYTYHQLYDQCNLDFRDLLRIGNIYMEIKTDEQSGMLAITR
jgi:hypothetical protein